MAPISRSLLFSGAVCLTTLLGMAAFAHAACTKPDGVGIEGEMIYNSDHKVMQFCNGTEWIAMIAGKSGGGGQAPTGSVMAFDLETCPDGWEPYSLSSGRFVRGKCITGQTCNDAGGVRVVGGVQTDEVKSHSHQVRARHGAADWNGGSVMATDAGGYEVSSLSTASGGAESRPKNVALLHCMKVD